MTIEEIVISGKTVSVFENHKLAPFAWMKEKSINGLKPAILTLDHHTDTRTAFNHNLYHQIDGEKRGAPCHSEIIERAKKICASIKSDVDIKEVIDDLRNDEHIDFSIRSEIISHAYVISNNTNNMFTMKSVEEKAWFEEKNKIENMFSGEEMPKPIGDGTFVLPENKIIELDNDMFYDFEIYDQREKCKLSISDRNLGVRLERINAINKSIYGVSYNFLDNFILDVDLDYFNTLEAIEPSEFSLFYMLIKRSRAITIAKESWHVEDCRMDEESITSDLLLDKILTHITKATSV
jgi:hypothetical protein